MDKRLPTIFLLLHVFFQGILYPQAGYRFSGDQTLFSGELIRYMGRNLSEEQMLLVTRFAGKWDSGVFSGSDMEGIINTTNMLVARNARPIPHFINYLEMLEGFLEHDPGGQHYPAWEKGFRQIIENDNISLQRINELTQFIAGLLSGNLLSRSSSVSWQSDNAGFTIIPEDTLCIEFTRLDLRGFNHIDTLTVFNTSGRLYPLSRTWHGRGGKLTWERAGFAQEEVYAILDTYSIDLIRSEYSADSALFNFSRYFNAPVSGRVTDRIMSTRNPEEAGYPRFISYRQEFTIRDIYPGVDYEGGYSMQGSKLIGSGSDHYKARLTFYQDGEKKLVAESGHFLFKPQGTGSGSTSVVFYLGNDSLYHPDLYLNFFNETRELSLNQTSKVISRSPWLNTYHRVDMSFARLIWKTDEKDMRLTMPLGSSMGNANFESLNLFDRNRYQRLQGMDNQHPLFLLRSFSDQYDGDNIPAEEYARFLRRPLSQIRHQLLDLTLQGFIFYDTDTDLIRIRPRLYHYLQANIRRIDYDVINFTSSTVAPLENAFLDIGTSDLTINGIPRVFLSNRQNVNIFTRNNQITMKRNRNFVFEGTINAGNLSLFGENFTFDYDRFIINLQKIDSISLRANLDETDMYGQALFANVRNLIRNVTGELYIDQADNKSGRIDYEGFPKLRSHEKSYVFYEDPQIRQGVYKSGNFYFELEPFFIDNLNMLGEENIIFTGKLVSAGIFPDIEGSLSLQNDFSLGISHSTDESGIPVYGGRGFFFDEIQMSNEGLKGKGRLDYLSSAIHSEDLVFMPDSMTATGVNLKTGRQATGTQFPDVRSENNLVKWIPEEDIMHIRRTDRNFAIFDGRAELDGALTISPHSLKGSGTVRLESADFSSENFLFGAEFFSSASTGLVVHDQGRNSIMLSATGLKSRIDLKTREAKLYRNQDNGWIDFPENDYIADPESFSWKMDRGEFEFFSTAVDPESGLAGARYISTGSGKDSLSFRSPRAVLDYNNNLLIANEVKYIEVADARIYTPGETILIGKNAEIMPVNEARIITGNEQALHEIYNARLQIDSKNDFSGSGSYDYTDEMNNVRTIRFNNISVNSDRETAASGAISGNDGFMLSPGFGFTGEAGLLSSRPNLNFNGATRIFHNCEGLGDNWLAFENIIDPVEVLIPVPAQPVSADRERIYAGIFVATDSVHIYPAFFSERKNYADQLILTAEGYMKYDLLSGEYIITSAEKLKNFELPGNFLILNPEECLLSGEGLLELGVSFGQVSINAAGSVLNRIQTNETSIEGFISVDFFMSDDALNLMAQQAESFPGSKTDPGSFYYTRGLDQLLGKEKAESLRSGYGGQGRQAQLPEELKKTIVISEITLDWNKESRSYRSRGDIGIAYINGVPVNKIFTGYLEITKRRSGDYFDLYIELDETNWYYFGYTRGVMQTFSSNHDYVNIINDLPLRTRKMNVPERETSYTYMLATDTRIDQFFRIYRHNKMGLDYEMPADDTLMEDNSNR